MAFTYAGRYGPHAITDQRGNAQLGALCYVYDHGTDTLATLWESRDKTTEAKNPVEVDANGNLSFFADPARYRVEVFRDGIKRFEYDVSVQADPSEQAPDNHATQHAPGGTDSLAGDFVRRISADVTFQIPSDYADLQSAVDDLANRVPDRGVTVTLNIESGHALTGGLLCQYGDYSMFRITSDDTTVPLDASWSGVDETSMQNPGKSKTDLLVIGEKAIMPTFACLIDMASVGGGGALLQNCRFRWETDAGIINAGSAAGAAGILTRYSHGSLTNSVWNGAASEGLRITLSSHVEASGAKVNNCGDGTQPAVFCSRGSMLNFIQAESKNANGDALRAHRSWVSASGANLDGASGAAAYARLSSVILVAAATLTNSGTSIRTQTGGHVTANDADLSGASGHSVWCDTGYVNIQNATIDGSQGSTAVLVDNGHVEAKGAAITGWNTRGVTCGSGSFYGQNSDISTTVSGTSGGILATNGGRVAVQGATISRPESPDANDISCANGSIVTSNGATHDGTNAPGTSKTVNAIDSDGIIFQ